MTTAAPPVRTPSYVDVDVLRDSHGLVAKISRRVKNGRYTFAIHKEYDRDGEKILTSFADEDKLDAYEEMVRTVRRRIGEIRAGESLASAPTESTNARDRGKR